MNDTLDPNTTLDQLTSLLKDDDANVRLAVAQALGGSTVRADAVLQSLLASRTDANPDVRQAVVHAISKSENRSDDVIQTITSFLADSDTNVRISTINAIGTMKLKSSPVVKAIMKSLESKDERILLATLASLVTLAPASDIATTEVAKQMKDARSSVRAQALALCKRRDRQKLTDALIQTLADSDWTVREKAAAEPGKLGSAARKAVPTLFGMLASEDDSEAVALPCVKLMMPDRRQFPCSSRGCNPVTVAGSSTPFFLGKSTESFGSSPSSSKITRRVR